MQQSCVSNERFGLPARQKARRGFLQSLQNWPGRHADRFKPTADKHLSVGFAAEMPGGWTCSGSHVPLDDGELVISALDHKPVDRILANDPANLALKFLQTRHAFSAER